MNYDECMKRIKELEHKALLKYVGDIPFTLVIEMLSEDEQEEYNKLTDE